MSTIAGMFFMRSGTPGQDTPPSGCSVAESENNLSEDDNTSCSASEMGCDLTVAPSSKESSLSSRKNKRKNFKPRNIMEYAGSEEDEDNGGSAVGRNRLNHNHRCNNNNNIRTPVVNADEEENDNNTEENDNDMDIDGGDQGEGDLEDDVDRPLDLSEVQNDPKFLWRKPELMNPLLSINNNSISTSNNNSQLSSSSSSSLQSPQMGNSFVFAPMAIDLRLSNSRAQQLQQQQQQHQQNSSSQLEEQFEDQSNDLMISSTSNSNASNHHGIPPTLAGGAGGGGSAGTAALTDFAESTMKELLGLYGIAENLRQAGKPSPEIPGMQRNLDSTGQSTKMMLPENMARLLAAMQESVTQAAAAQSVHAGGGMGPNQNCFNNNSNSSTNSNNNNNVISNSGSNGGSPSSLNLNVNVNPLSYASINNLVQQHQISSGSNKSQLNSNNINNNNNNSIFPGHHHQLPNLTKGPSSKPKATGKSPSGRGLTSFPVIREGLLGKGTGPVDYTRYVRRYSNSSECGFQQCRELNYREHFHCLDCGEGTRVFVKKEEMIRHFKWHKKRDESLQHGFMRYSPMDDCSDRFRNCSHNRKQTHYHCLQDGCEKVYISTSDVQMHANYHRKDSAIIQEGFQRFRAAEDCGADHCSFRHQRTTHFHCRRTSCSYTFKNKADMEKHKSYHIKDEQLNRDGFKKFMKHEACHYSNCRFSRVCNHIHCIREGCNYVLHSSGQLYSHKRKHERRDSELAYRKFKLAQSLMRGTFGAELTGLSVGDSLSLNASMKSEEENSRSSATEHGDLDAEELMKKFIQPCKCDQSEDEHFHCKVDTCANAVLGTSETASEHGRNHELEDRISSLAFFTVDPASFDAQDSTIPCISAKCPYQTREKHYHCLWDGCTETIVASDGPFKRLDHFKAHEYTQKLDLTDKCDSLDGFFRRKRGRPPKNRVIEVSSGANEAIFTSFKLPKPIFGGALDSADTSDGDVKDPIGFLSYPEGTSCPDSSCSFNTSTSTCHYHCGHPRCHFSVADVHKLSLHLRDFHTNVDILEGYAYFDKNSDCRESNCEFNGSTEHFHCIRDGHGFLRYTATVAHEAECHESKSNGSSDDEDRAWNNQIVKASGTFYPLSAVQRKEGSGADPMDLSSPNGSTETTETKPITDHSLSRILQLPSPDSGETQYGPEVACGRPFCKLKRKCHFHCHLCNQAFSELEKLRPHVVKHSNFSPLKPANESEDASTDEDSGKNDSDDQPEMKLFPKVEDKGTPPKLEGPSTSFTPTSIQNFLSGYTGSHSPYTHLFLQQNPLTSLYAGMMFGGAAGFPPASVLSPPTPPALAVPVPSSNGTGPVNGLEGVSPIQMNPSVPQLPLKVKRPPSASSSSPSSPPESKKQRLQMRILKDEPVPDGYIRFRFNEDCAYTHCGYREHQTHFHCTREDCGYSFCDKTRFVQHTARHERLDTLMGGDFKQYRANISCGRSNCSYVPNTGSTQGQNKASHFHCSKCDFVCTDTNKVVAHRRQHQKLDSIMAAGFEKFTPSQHCHIEACIHAQKQTHYHCLKCSYAVLGLSQMSAHKYRHVD